MLKHLFECSRPKVLVLTMFFMLFVNCSTPQKPPADLDLRIPVSTSDQALFFKTRVQPILNSRCVVCHACTEAPCQLHLDSYEGIRRGATYTDMGANLLYSEPTRDKDASSFAEWRKKNFFPIVPDPVDNPQEQNGMPQPPDSELSLLYRFLELGHRTNKPGFPLEATIKYREKGRVCAPNVPAFENFAKEFPHAGMPYGFPGLDKDQLKTIKTWIDQGAPNPAGTEEASLKESPAAQQIREWESAFNANSKSLLAARYVYEHVFSAHIHFKDSPHNEWYELVRSSTKAPNPIKEIITPRPYDPPQKSPVYYRFKYFNRTVAKASHIPWELDEKALERFKSLFLQTPWLSRASTGAVDQEPIQDPGYTSINPFKYFKQIPASIRYQFMLENSHLIANAMIRGPACSGRVATNAIRDHFWVFFLKPEADVTVLNPEIGVAEWTPLSELDLKAFVEPSLKYTNAMKKLKPQGFAVGDLWNDSGKSKNALLTIFRHGTNASVHQGLIGGKPLTYWVLNYSNFERIYYNLVADFELWGSSAHKASTWNYMSRHRSEAEERFISFLPEKFRDTVRSNWTQGLGKAQNLSQAALSHGIKTSVTLNDPNDPVESLLEQFFTNYQEPQINASEEIRKVTGRNGSLNQTFENYEDWEQAFINVIEHPEFAAVRYLPDVIFIRMHEKTYTILNHRYYKFNNLLALEKLAYEPSKNRIYLMRNLVGDRPEYFADLPLSKAHLFLRDLQKVQLFSDWVAFKNKYLIRRNQEKVWSMSDWMFEWQRKHDPIESGVFDLREYDLELD